MLIKKDDLASHFNINNFEWLHHGYHAISTTETAYFTNNASK
jgi:hypothetical protein